MIARLLILIARGWQLGPSRILPPTCRYAPSCSEVCDRRAETSRCDQGWLAGDKAAIALPPLGRTRLRPGAM